MSEAKSIVSGASSRWEVEALAAGAATATIDGLRFALPILRLLILCPEKQRFKGQGSALDPPGPEAPDAL